MKNNIKHIALAAAIALISTTSFAEDTTKKEESGGGWWAGVSAFGGKVLATPLAVVGGALGTPGASKAAGWIVEKTGAAQADLDKKADEKEASKHHITMPAGATKIGDYDVAIPEFPSLENFISNRIKVEMSQWQWGAWSSTRRKPGGSIESQLYSYGTFSFTRPAGPQNERDEVEARPIRYALLQNPAPGHFKGHDEKAANARQWRFTDPSSTALKNNAATSVFANNSTSTVFISTVVSATDFDPRIMSDLPSRVDKPYAINVDEYTLVKPVGEVIAIVYNAKTGKAISVLFDILHSEVANGVPIAFNAYDLGENKDPSDVMAMVFDKVVEKNIKDGLKSFLAEEEMCSAAQDHRKAGGPDYRQGGTAFCDFPEPSRNKLIAIARAGIQSTPELMELMSNIVGGK